MTVKKLPVWDSNPRILQHTPYEFRTGSNLSFINKYRIRNQKQKGNWAEWDFAALLLTESVAKSLWYSSTTGFIQSK